MNTKHPYDADRCIDSALRSLRAAQPSPNLEQRVLSAMAQRAEELESHPKRDPSGRRSQLWFLSLATATAAAMLVAFLLTRTVHFPPPQSAHNTSASTQPAAAIPTQAASTTPTATAPHRKNLPPPPHRSLAAATPTSLPAPLSLDPATCHCDPVAMAEAAAPSHPAPPMPLTPQERRFLRIVRDGHYQQVADLDPARLERDLARDRAAFDAYFPPPPPPPDPQEGNPQP